MRKRSSAANRIFLITVSSCYTFLNRFAADVPILTAAKAGWMNPRVCVRVKVSMMPQAGLDASSPASIFCIGRSLLFVAGNSPGGVSPENVMLPSAYFHIFRQ